MTQIETRDQGRVDSDDANISKMEKTCQEVFLSGLTLEQHSESTRTLQIMVDVIVRGIRQVDAHVAVLNKRKTDLSRCLNELGMSPFEYSDKVKTDLIHLGFSIPPDAA